MTAPGDDVLTLPRLTVNAGIGVAGLARLLGSRPTPAGRRAAAVKRVTWRAIRQAGAASGQGPAGRAACHVTAAGESIGWRPAAYRERGRPADTSAARSRLPVSVVALIAATGVLVVAAAYTAGRQGHAGAPWADRMYWLGQLLILTPVAARLLSRRALAASETVTLVVVLTVAEYLVKVCYSPAAFTYADELMHWRTRDGHHADRASFSPRTTCCRSARTTPAWRRSPRLWPPSPGFRSSPAGLIVAGAAHLLFVCVLFVLFRYVSGSHRIAGVALLLYASESLFQSFDSMFVYQTLALPFLGLTVLAVYRLAAAAGGRPPRRLVHDRRAVSFRHRGNAPRDQLCAGGHSGGHHPGRPCWP